MPIIFLIFVKPAADNRTYKKSPGLKTWEQVAQEAGFLLFDGGIWAKPSPVQRQMYGRDLKRVQAKKV